MRHYGLMQALRIEQFGDPAEVIHVQDLIEPPLAPGEVRVRIEASALNPSDAVNARGRFPQTTLPRTLGRDFAGTVVEGPRELIGAPVWGSGGDIGYTRDGTHAEFLHIPAAAAVRRPANLSSEQAAAVGVPFLTAWSALELAHVPQGGWLIASGATGAVGGAVLQLARARGLNVIALVRNASDAGTLHVPAATAEQLEARTRAITGGRGADAGLNGIGASVTPAFLKSLAKGGRLVVYSVAFGGREVALDLFALYRARHQILGLDTAALGVVQGAAILAQLTPMFESGVLAPPTIAATFSLAAAREAFARLASAKGKIIFLPAATPPSA